MDACLKSIVCFCFRWLDYLISRIIFQAKAFVKNASKGREKVGKEIKAILSRLGSIEKQQNKVIRDLHEYLDERADGAMQELSKYISSEEVKERFTKWTLDEVPKAESSWEVTENQITKVLSDARIHTAIGRR